MPQAHWGRVDEKAFNKQVKLGNTRIFRGYGSKVHIPRPFNQNVFYYVSDNGIMNANESKMLTRSVSMGAHVEKCSAGTSCQQRR
jgi:hypothetical protein